MTGPPQNPVLGQGLRCFAIGVVFALWGCAPSAHLRLLLHMPEAQKQEYRQNVLRPFEKSARCRVEVVTYATPEDLLDVLRRAPDSLQPDLVEMPQEMAITLARSGLMRPLEDRLDGEAAQALREGFFFGDLARVDGRQWFWPRHLETPLMFYLKSRTAQASRFWDMRKPEIDAALKRSGLGELRKDYALSPDPHAWNRLDLFVAAGFWRQQERQGRRRARISLGAGSPHETGLMLMGSALQQGLGADPVQRLDASAVQAALAWPERFCREGLVRSGSFRGESFDSVATAVQAGEVYLAEVTPRQAFILHGNGTPQLPGYLPDPDDMGIAPLPAAWSLNEEQVRREGALTRLWMWGLGRGRGDPAKAVALMQHLNATSSLVYEASRFGLIPAKKEVISELPLIFGGGWAGEIYQAAARQLIENGPTLPPQTDAFPELAQAWSQAARTACAQPAEKGRLPSLSLSEAARARP